jgi:hypothetical protein
LALPLAAALLAFWPAGAFALSEGTSGADFLDIDVGARPTAMGGAFTAAADDVNATQWNPAGLALIPRSEITISHMAYIADINYESIAAGGPIDRWSGWGASVNYLWQPPFDSTANDFGLPTQTAATGYDIAAAASYAYNFGSIRASDFEISNISLGGSLKLIEENLSSVNGAALYGDLGFLAELLPGLRLGLLWQNFGTTMTFVNEALPPPMNTKLGLSWNLKVNDANRLLLAFDVNHPVDPTNVDYVRWHENVGLEYWLFNRVALRGGYEINYDLTGMTAGAGFRWNALELDYAFVPYGDLGYVNQVSLVYDYGGKVSRPDAAAPPAPRNLRGIAGDRLVSLSWDKSTAKDVIGYNVYYTRDSGRDYVRTNEKPEADRTGLDVRLQNDETYFFVVTAVNGQGRESEYSSEVSLKPHAPVKPEAPEDLTTDVQGRTVTLTWKAGLDKNVIGYNVYYSKTSGKDYRKLTKAAPLKDTECRLNGLASGSEYFFVVTAVTREGLESDRSSEAEAKPQEDTVNEPAPELPLKRTKVPTPSPNDEPI